MKLVFCVDSMNSGGAERVTSILANNFINNGNEVSIVMVSYNKRESFYKLNDKVNLIALCEGYTKRVNSLKRIKLLRNKIKEIKPDVVISFLYHVNVYTSLALKGLKIPHIVSERNNPYNNDIGLLVRLLRKPVFRHASGCVFQTHDAYRYYFKKDVDRAVVIPNPISLRSEPVFNIDRKKEILFVGRLTPQKNIKLLLDSFSDVHEKHPDYKLKIYGSGELEQELKDYCISLEIDDSVLFVGNSTTWQEDEKDTSMYVLSSDYEGMSNSLMEALALGIPSISTDCPIGGSRELIRDGENGLLVPVGDREALTNAMLKLIENPGFASQLSLANKDMVQRYSEEEIAKQWMSFIKTIIKRKKS